MFDRCRMEQRTGQSLHEGAYMFAGMFLSKSSIKSESPFFGPLGYVSSLS